MKKRTAHRGLPPYVQAITQSGRVYYYFRRQGPNGCHRRPLPGAPFDDAGLPRDEWWAAYRDLGGDDAPIQAFAGTFAALIATFKRSADWERLAQRTRDLWTDRLAVVERVWGQTQVAPIRPKHILALRDKFAATPGQANNLIAALSAMLSWAAKREWLETNPCLGMQNLKFPQEGDGYEAWPPDMIELFEEISDPLLWFAAAVALYTGQRRADCLKLKWSDERDGVIFIKQKKTGKILRIPMHKKLKAVWQKIPRQSEHVLCGIRNTRWTDNAFGARWHAQMRTPQFALFRKMELTFHGLRKSAVNALLEAGCTTAEVSAITGHSLDMIERYAQQVNQLKLARSALRKVEEEADRLAAEEHATRANG